MTKTINKSVEVNAFYFAGKSAKTKMFPKKITVDGRQYRFAKTGIELVVHKGQTAIKLFTMSDGKHNFKIKNELNDWVLTSISSEPNEAWA